MQAPHPSTAPGCRLTWSSKGSVPVVNSPSSQFWLTGHVSRNATTSQMIGATMAEARAANRAAASRPAPSALPTRVEAAMPNAAKLREGRYKNWR